MAWVGLSTKSFGPVTLPFDLTTLGAPGCKIHTEIFHLVTLPATGKAVWSIPNNAFMVNQLVYIQGAGLATNANALGLVTSECRFAKIGTGSPQDPGVAECIFGLKGRGPYQSGSSLNLGAVVKLDGVFF